MTVCEARREAPEETMPLEPLGLGLQTREKRLSVL